ncbi:MAG: hypothetical protein AAFU58_00150 [Pseudomonadota bacterium]
MIFRRIKAHIEKENWFAVFIDFCIVVVGVFIGIQVANWNASQFERREEAAIVERLRDDFERIEEDADRSLAFHTRMTEDLRTVLRSLRTGVLKDKDTAAFERALLLGPAFQTSADRAGTFTELMSSGRGNILQDRDLLHMLVDYQDFLERYAFAQKFYTEYCLIFTEAFRRGYNYSTDIQLTEDAFALIEPGQSIVSYDFEALVSDPAFHDATEEFLFMHSGTILWRKRISDRIDVIRQRLTETVND